VTAPRAAARLLGAVAWSFVLPVAATLATLKLLVPSPLDGGERGFWALLARLGEQQPLPLGLGLFLLFSATVTYWRGRRVPIGSERRLETGRVALVFVLLVLLAAAFAARVSVAEIYRVVSPSMVPTLNAGDRLLVDKHAYGWRLPFAQNVLRARPPRRGDVIVFAADPARDAAGPAAVVKRVVGLPGDFVAFRGGSPIVNGWIVPSCDAGPFISVSGRVTVRGRIAVEFLEDRAYLTVRTPLDDSVFAGYLVPPGEVFVLGDDRGMSSDSRAWNEGRGGGVRLADIRGKVSRLAVGGRPDGRLDLSRVLAPLGLAVREPRIDVRDTEARIAQCLASPPRASWPPPPLPAPR
jgi:signal peptidase I